MLKSPQNNCTREGALKPSSVINTGNETTQQTHNLRALYNTCSSCRSIMYRRYTNMMRWSVTDRRLRPMECRSTVCRIGNCTGLVQANTGIVQANTGTEYLSIIYGPLYWFIVRPRKMIPPILITWYTYFLGCRSCLDLFSTENTTWYSTFCDI